MATATIVRSRGIPSPLRLGFKSSPSSSSTPKSILKRPNTLPLSPSPFPFSNTFNVLYTASVQSPHVHFPPSPSLFATFSTHSPNTYDRGPILVSPNLLELPAWGDRVYSPSIHSFKLQDPPKHVSVKKLRVPTPGSLSSDDPRSPRPNTNPNYAARSSLARGSKPRGELGRALSTFPRSPYPSAPLTPAEESDGAMNDTQEGNGNRNKENRGRGWPKQRGKSNSVSLTPRARSVDTTRKSIMFNITPARRLTPPQLTLTSPLFPSFPSPVREGSQVKVATHINEIKEEEEGIDTASSGSGESSELRRAFWKSISLEHDGGIETSPGGFPESVAGGSSSSQGSIELMFGREDGTLWSPGFPSMPKRENGVNNYKKEIARSSVAAPTPNDPFAAFPSFSAVLMLAKEDEVISVPPRALIVG